MIGRGAKWIARIFNINTVRYANAPYIFGSLFFGKSLTVHSPPALVPTPERGNQRGCERLRYGSYNDQEIRFLVVPPCWQPKF